MYKAILVDDERPALLELHYVLTTDKRLNIVGSFQNPIEALQTIKKEKPDVVFLDIHMPDLSGLDLAEKILTHSPCTEIVFTTAYDQYALNAYDHAALDYVLKPYDEKRLATTITRVIDHLNKHQQSKSTRSLSKVPVWHQDVIKLIALEDITYFCSQEGKSYLATAHKTYEITQTLKYLEDLLSNQGFMRIHKSYLVNLSKVEQIIPWFNATYMLVVKHAKEHLPVSRKQVKAIKEHFSL